jgi:hypothetical protein
MAEGFGAEGEDTGASSEESYGTEAEGGDDF